MDFRRKNLYIRKMKRKYTIIFGWGKTGRDTWIIMTKPRQREDEFCLENAKVWNVQFNCLWAGRVEAREKVEPN